MTFQMMGINREIVLGKKTCRAVIAPLDNMREQATRSQARTAGHRMGTQNSLSWLLYPARRATSAAGRQEWSLRFPSLRFPFKEDD